MFNDFPEDNQNDDFLNEFRQKLANQSTARIEEKQKEMQRSKSVFLGAATGIGLACAVGWFVLAPRYSSNLESEIPVVKRPQTAVKIKPTEPGGMEISNQDKSIYDIIDKNEGKEKTVENLLPPPEEPKLPEVVAETVSETEQVVAQAPATDATNTEVQAVATNETVVQESVEAQPVQNEVAQDKTVSIAEASEKLQAEPQKRSALFVDPRVAYQERLKEKQAEENAQFELAKAEAAKQAKERATGVAETSPTAPTSVQASVETPKVETIAQAPVASGPTTAAAGSWQIQLMSSKNKDAVEKSWTGLVKKYAFLSGLPYEIETADIDFGSTYYRLKTGAFTNKADADKVCNQIKAAGGSCLVKKK